MGSLDNELEITNYFTYFNGSTVVDRIVFCFPTMLQKFSNRLIIECCRYLSIFKNLRLEKENESKDYKLRCSPSADSELI